jgi:acyl-CoA-dependent ceramide synthase
MILAVLAAWASWAVLLPDRENPFSAAVLISYPLPRRLGEDRTYYTYGYRDVAFLAFYVIAFSFFRQASTEYIVAPIGRAGGIRREIKLLRFMEQGYAALYFSIFGTFGIVRARRSALRARVRASHSTSCAACPHGGSKRATSGPSTRIG